MPSSTHHFTFQNRRPYPPLLEPPPYPPRSGKLSLQKRRSKTVHMRASAVSILTKVPATAATTTAKVVLHWAKVGGLGVVVAHVIVGVSTAAATTTVTYNQIVCKTSSQPHLEHRIVVAYGSQNTYHSRCCHNHFLHSPHLRLHPGCNLGYTPGCHHYYIHQDRQDHRLHSLQQTHCSSTLPSFSCEYT